MRSSKRRDARSIYALLEESRKQYRGNARAVLFASPRILFAPTWFRAYEKTLSKIFSSSKVNWCVFINEKNSKKLVDLWDSECLADFSFNSGKLIKMDLKHLRFLWFSSERIVDRVSDVNCLKKSEIHYWDPKRWQSTVVNRTFFFLCSYWWKKCFHCWKKLYRMGK